MHGFMTLSPRRDGAARTRISPEPAEPAEPTILILTAPTGAGHDSVATALADALRAALPRAHVRVWNPLRGRGIGALQAGSWYHVVVAHAPRLWGWLYRRSDNERGVRLGAAAMAALWGPGVRATIRAVRPDLIVSVHPLCARLAADALRREGYPAPHHCVVTDLASIHRSWAAPDVAAFYVATPQAAAALQLHAVPPERIQVTGLPLRRAFAALPPTTPRPIPADDPAPRVLALDGGRATRALERAARALLAADPPLRVTIVCGGNARLRRRLMRLAAGRATVLGWRHDVARLMRASDVVVTKAGSVTLAEAWSQGRPALVYHVFPGQEEGNVALLEQRDGQSRYVPVVDALPTAVRRAHARERVHDGIHAAWWGQAADRVAAGVTGALRTRRRAIPSEDGRPRPAPRPTRRRAIPPWPGCARAVGRDPGHARVSRAGDAPRRSRDALRHEEDSVL